MGGDLDERQERITLALYGGVLAALGFLVVAFLLYLHTILPLLGQLSTFQTDPSLTGDGVVVSDLPSDPAVVSTAVGSDGESAISPSLLTATVSEPAMPRTQFLLLVGVTMPGAAMIGWALCRTWQRGLALTGSAHLALALFAFAWVTPQTGGLDFVLPLYLLPVVLVLALLLPQRPTTLFLLLLVPALVGFPLLPQFGWWVVPLAWIVLPIAGAIVAAYAATAEAA